MKISKRTEQKTKSTKPLKHSSPVIIKNISHPNIRKVSMHKFSNGNEVPVFEINDYRALNQMIGYAKFKNTEYGDVFYRGEVNLHNSLLPSISRKPNCSKYEQALNETIAKVLNDEKLVKLAQLSGFKGNKNPFFVAEAMLQHYGYSTHFLDLVDNHWVALWFGLNQFDCIKNVSEYSLYRTRSINPIDINLNKDYKESIYQYMLMVAVDNNAAPVERGIYVGNDTITIDLRSSLPSIFLRPHAQHGLVVRKNIHSTNETFDLANNVVGIVKLRIDNVISWIGDGDLLSSSNLFPSPAYDYGYEILLNRTDLFNNELHKIVRYI